MKLTFVFAVLAAFAIIQCESFGWSLLDDLFDSDECKLRALDVFIQICLTFFWYILEKRVFKKLYR